MDASLAQDHLQMVDRILSRAEQKPYVSGSPFVVWGIVGASFNIVTQLIVLQHGSPSMVWISIALLAAALVYMVFFGLGVAKRERHGLLDRHVGNLFMIAWIVALFVMALGGHIFADWAAAALWSLMFGAAMMNCASLAGSRTIFAGGIIMILSIVAANFYTHYAGYILAAGDVIGMGGTGLALILARGND